MIQSVERFREHLSADLSQSVNGIHDPGRFQMMMSDGSVEQHDDVELQLIFVANQRIDEVNLRGGVVGKVIGQRGSDEQTMIERQPSLS